MRSLLILADTKRTLGDGVRGSFFKVTDTSACNAIVEQEVLELIYKPIYMLPFVLEELSGQ